MKKTIKDMSLMKANSDNIVLFYPHVSELAKSAVMDTLNSRWIGQGPRVKLFEENFRKKFASNFSAIAVGSGTDALHLSYILAGLKPGDEVIAPVFTCTATNIPFLYMGVKIHFADIDLETMNIDSNHVRELMSNKVRAIICIHYGGLPCDMDELKNIADEWNIPIIEDAAQAVGAKYKGVNIGNISDFTIFSFQAIKHIATGDGGMLIIKDKKLVDKAERIRWFGIDRKAKQEGIWENDITEIGYKYQMTDISATLGCDSLSEFSKILSHRRKIFDVYLNELSKNKNIHCVNDLDNKKKHAAWLFTIVLEKKDFLQKKLRDYKIETNQVHFRNDRYSIFKKYVQGAKLKNMDYLENKYLVLPLHHKLSVNRTKYICGLINKLI